jgi:hypothetical protein
MIFKIFSPKISAKKLAFLTQNKAKFGKKLIITLVFEKNANFFAENLSKNAENCDHNIDPCFIIPQKCGHALIGFDGLPYRKLRILFLKKCVYTLCSTMYEGIWFKVSCAGLLK